MCFGSPLRTVRWRSAWTVLHRTGFSQGLGASCLCAPNAPAVSAGNIAVRCSLAAHHSSARRRTIHICASRSTGCSGRKAPGCPEGKIRNRSGGHARSRGGRNTPCGGGHIPLCCQCQRNKAQDTQKQQDVSTHGDAPPSLRLKNFYSSPAQDRVSAASNDGLFLTRPV